MRSLLAMMYPITEELTDELYGSNVFSKLDSRRGYHQIGMTDLTLVKLLYELMKDLRVCGNAFKLLNAPATFRPL